MMHSPKNGSDVSSISFSQTSPLAILSRAIRESKIVFIGTYVEKRYVERLKVYRDIINVDNDEDQLYKCLDEIKKIAQQYASDKWLGLTCNMKDSIVESYNLWVELEGIPLGRHWFQLKSLKVKDQSVQLHVKYLRTAKESIHRGTLNISEHPEFEYRELLTYDNVIGTLKLLAVLTMSLLTVLCNGIWYFGDYSVKMIHELSGLVRAFTPILFAIIDFFSKCVGGLYWLIYMIFRDDSVPPYVMKPPIGWDKRRSKNYERRAICQ